MARYIFKGSRTHYNGVFYSTGDEIEMADDSAKSIEDLLTPVSQAPPKETTSVKDQKADRPATQQTARRGRPKTTNKGQGRKRASTRR